MRVYTRIMIEENPTKIHTVRILQRITKNRERIAPTTDIIFKLRGGFTNWSINVKPTSAAPDRNAKSLQFPTGVSTRLNNTPNDVNCGMIMWMS